MSENDPVVNPFPADTYDTPDSFPRSIWEYVTLGTRLSFYFRNFYVFCKSGYQAKHTPFMGEAQTRNSLENFRITESCGGRIHLRGLDNLDRTNGPCVIIGNHMSLLETAVLHAFVRPHFPFCFVIKDSLFRVPFFGDIMRRLGCIAVGRANPRDDFKHVLNEGKKRLDEGVSVILFPQSSRSAVFDESKFNTIGVKLAKHASVPIVPLALRTDFLKNGKLVKDLGPVCRKNPVWFEFGTPLNVAGSGKEEHRQIIDFIESHLVQWGCKIKKQESVP